MVYMCVRMCGMCVTNNGCMYMSLCMYVCGSISSANSLILSLPYICICVPWPLCS